MRFTFQLASVIFLLASCVPAPEATFVPTLSLQPAHTPTLAPTEQPVSISPHLKIGNGDLEQLKWSPTGETVIIGTSTGVFVYSTKDFSLLNEFEIGERVYYLAVHPNGQIISTGADSDSYQHITLWDIRSGKPVTTLYGDCGCVFTNVAFSPDGSLLAAGNDQGAVWIWEWEAGKVVKILHLNASKYPSIRYVQFDSDGSSLIAGEQIGSVELFDVATGKSLQSYDGQFEWITDVNLSPDGTQVAVAGRLSIDEKELVDHEKLKVFDRLTGKVIYTIDPKVQSIFFAVYTPNGKSLLIGVCPGYGFRAEICPKPRLELWNAQNGTFTKVIDEYEGELISADYSPDGRQFALISQSIDIIPIFEIRNMESNQVAKTIDWYIGPTSPIVFSPDSKTAIYGEADGTIKFGNVETGEITSTLDTHGNQITNLAINSDGTLLASSSWTGEITLWDLKTKMVIRKIEMKDGDFQINSLRFSPNNRWLAWIGVDLNHEKDRVQLYDLKTQAMELAAQGTSIFDIAISPDSSILAVGDFDENTVTLFKIPAGKLLSLFKSPNGIEDVEFSPDGATLLAADFNLDVHLLDVLSGKLVKTLPEVGSPIVFSPDGNFFLSSYGPKLRLWRVKNGVLILEKTHRIGATRNISISLNGQIIGTSGIGGAGWLWKIEGMH